MTVSIFKSAINPSFKLVMGNGYKAITLYDLFNGHD